jgi:hypothetical protein
MLSAGFLRQISLELENKYESIAVILTLIFRKLTINQQVFPDMSCAKLYPNSMSNVQHTHKISIYILK